MKFAPILKFCCKLFTAFFMVVWFLYKLFSYLDNTNSYGKE
jgi:hypothetical protein